MVGKRAYGSRSSTHYLTENFCRIAVCMTSQTASVVTLGLTGFRATLSVSGDECWQTRGETGLQRNIQSISSNHFFFLYISSLRLLSKLLKILATSAQGCAPSVLIVSFPDPHLLPHKRGSGKITVYVCRCTQRTRYSYVT